MEERNLALILLVKCVKMDSISQPLQSVEYSGKKDTRRPSQHGNLD